MSSDNTSFKVQLPMKTEQKLACATCGSDTYHEVLTGVVEDGLHQDLNYTREYWTVQCKGCKSISFCQRFWTSEDWEYDANGREVRSIREQLYPSRISGRKQPDWVLELPHEIRQIYVETRSAFCNEEPILTGIGLRAVVEAVCTYSGLLTGVLKTKIDALMASGKITSDAAKILHSLRFMGNASAHEIKAHTPTELKIALDIVESLLHSTLIVPRYASKLPSYIP